MRAVSSYGTICHYLRTHQRIWKLYFRVGLYLCLRSLPIYRPLFRPAMTFHVVRSLDRYTCSLRDDPACGLPVDPTRTRGSSQWHGRHRQPAITDGRVLVALENCAYGWSVLVPAIKNLRLEEESPRDPCGCGCGPCGKKDGLSPCTLQLASEVYTSGDDPCITYAMAGSIDRWLFHGFTWWSCLPARGAWWSDQKRSPSRRRILRGKERILPGCSQKRRRVSSLRSFRVQKMLYPVLGPRCRAYWSI